MTASSIADRILPYTPEECRCGQKKIPKMQKRVKLMEMLAKYWRGEQVDFLTLLASDEYEKLKSLLCPTTDA